MSNTRPFINKNEFFKENFGQTSDTSQMDSIYNNR